MLLPNWRRVLFRAWSMWLILFIGLLQGLDVALPIVGMSLPLPDGWLPWVTIIVAVAAAISRLIPQPKLQEDGDADK